MLLGGKHGKVGKQLDSLRFFDELKKYQKAVQ
jgi:hypothetical protein